MDDIRQAAFQRDTVGPRASAAVRRHALLATVALLAPALANAAPASAQDATPAAAATAPDAAALAEQSSLADIIVTANRRSESQQKVPITISAFGGEQLVKLGVTSTVDLPQLTPGLSLTRTLASSNAFLRGVGTITSGYTTESPVATYIDGLYLPNAAAAAFTFNNVERIEVLKGPQGTLYGRNTTGGLIQVITKDPGPRTSIDAAASYANYDTKMFNFYGSTPITDTLGANIAVSYTDQDNGWGRNILLDTPAFRFEDFGLQGKLRWEPTPDTKITLRGFFDRLRTDEGNSASVFPGSTGVDGSRYLGKYSVATRRDPYVVQRQYFLSLKAEQDFGFATLTSITGYINNRSPSNNIQNGIPGNPVSGQSAVNLDILARARTFSQELQLASNRSTSKVQWIAGLFYYHDDTSVRADVYGTCIGNVCTAAPASTRTTGKQKTRSYSAYGEGTYNVSPSTRITLGLRYTSDQKSLSGLTEPLQGLPNTLSVLPPSVVLRPGDPFAALPSGIDTDVTFGKLTWKAVLAQDFSPAIHAYASYNRGFKSGTYNPTVFTNPPSRPEVLDAYEIGVKSELFDRRLRLNVAAFYYDYSDIQLRSGASPAPPGGSILFNAASAHIKGVDADFVLAPLRGLTLNGGLEVLDARYSSFATGTCIVPRTPTGVILGGTTSVPCDLTGNRLPSAPKLSFNLGVTYNFDTPIGTFTVNANDGYKSSYFWDTDNRITQSSYHLVNTSLTWTANDPRYSVQLFAKNLTDTYYYSSGSEGTAGNDVYVPAAPRTYGVTARYHF